MTLLYIFAVIVSLIIYLVSGDGKFNNFSDPTLQFIVRENPNGLCFCYGSGIHIFFCVFQNSIASPSIFIV